MTTDLGLGLGGKFHPREALSAAYRAVSLLYARPGWLDAGPLALLIYQLTNGSHSNFFLLLPLQESCCLVGQT